MQAQQLGVREGRLLLLFNNNVTRNNHPSSLHRTAPTSLKLHIRHLLQLHATLQRGNVTEIVAGAKLVKVKFVLQKRCEFGQQFRVVGADEVLGSWNPKAALPMQWSEGHIWTTELEVVPGKRIEFKLILAVDEGVLEWQPGPNHVLIAMESSSPLVVLETWPGENQGATFFGLERVDNSDKQFLSREALTESIGREELPISVTDSEAVLENIEITNDGSPSEENSLVTEKQTMSLALVPVNMDTARELSILEKDVQWIRETFSVLWDKLRTGKQRAV